MDLKKQKIAVFDSGVGGISVLRELIGQMPGENFLYYGDNANAPYGKRTTENVRQLTLTAAEMLFSRDVKALVVACNTATAAAIAPLRWLYEDRIIVGIEPALKLAADRFPGGSVGIMATPVTLREEKLASQLSRFPGVTTHLVPVPDLVELVEQGHLNDDAVENLLRPVLEPLAGNLDAVVLGCTHYPFAAKTISKILGEQTTVLDGGEGTALQTRRRLLDAGLLNEEGGSVQLEFSDPNKHTLSLAYALLEGDLL